jgi:hypothetical protein
MTPWRAKGELVINVVCSRRSARVGQYRSRRKAVANSFIDLIVKGQKLSNTSF